MEKIASLYWRNSLFMKKGCKVKNFICLLVIAFLSICVSNAFAASKPEFTIKIGTLNIDGVKDADIENKCTVFELTERIDAVGPLDKDSNYIVYVCYDKNNIYFACDADDDVVISSDIAEADYRDSDYIRFYLATEDDFEGITVFTKTQYAFVWTPQDKDAKWNPQVREVSKTSYGGTGHAKLDGDAVAEFINSKSGPTDNGWYVEASIGWDVLGVTKEEKNLLGRIVGIMFIAGDTDKDNEGAAVQEREGEVRLPSDKTAAGGYWNSPDHLRVAELENGKFAVESTGKLTASWGALKAE
jgi:hypothetical protein